MKKCKSCQTEIDDKAKKCPSCRADQRNWLVRHKITTAILAFIVLAVLVSATGSKDTSNDGGTNNNSGSSNQAKTYRFNKRADKQETDVEVLPGEPATIDDLNLTVTKIIKKTTISEFEQAGSGKIYVIANVTLKNNSNETKPYNEADFRIQTASGQVLDGTVVVSDIKPLNYGDLVAGGKVSGQVVFEAPIEKGKSQYIIWKPTLESDRVIVRVK